MIMTLTRMGDCNHCGWCCQFEGLHRNVVESAAPNEKVEPDEVAFYTLRGGKVDIDGRLLRYIAQAYLPCSAHDSAEKKCKAYDVRPSICREFPAIPEQIEGTPCSHWFEGTLPNGEIIQRGGEGSLYPTPPRFAQ